VRLIILLALIFVFPTAFATQTDEALHNLSESRTWLKLLHFDQREGWFQGETRSAVADTRFFLSDRGQNNAHAELLATITAMQAPAGEDNTHATCRFPARAQFLRAHEIEIHSAATCSNRDEWLEAHQKDRVGVMFASGYLGNPASFFGHMLLHLGPITQSDTPITLLDTSLNFGADTGDDGIVPYILKGLFGGYRARYSEALFFHNSAIYSESEMRDLWQYELALNEADTEFLILHLWEILGQNFDYLFLSENCASRIARTLELVIDADLAASSMPYVAPETVMRNLSQAQYEGSPVVQQRTHKPSRRLLTEHQFHQLTEVQQNALLAVWQDAEKLNFDAPSFRGISTTDRGPVIDVILSHLLTLEETESELPIAQLKQQALIERLKLPTSPQVAKPAQPEPIESAIPSSMFRAGLFTNDAMETHARFSFRPLHYDLLQSSATRMPYASLEVLKLEVNIKSSSAELNRIQLFDVTNLYVQRTPLPEMSSRAWQVAAQIAPVSLSCIDCLNFDMDLKAGWSRKYGDWIPYALAGAQLSSTGYQQGPVALTGTFGLLYIPSIEHRTSFTATLREGFAGNLGRRSAVKLEHLWQLSQTYDLRFSAQVDRFNDQKGQEFGLAFSFYW